MIDTEALRKKVIDLAIRGKLTEQLPSDGDAETLYTQIQDHKAQLIKEGKIKKDKALPDIAADEIPFEIPDNWKWVRYQDVYFQIGNKNNQITSSELLPTGSFPAISQGIIFIDGFSNDESKVLYDIPVVLFGDHTRNVKYIDEPFVICADGTKLMKTICINCKFFYYVTCYLSAQIQSRGYARHYSMLKKNIVAMPPLAEQIRIVYKLEEILAQIDIIDDLQEKYSNDLAVLKSKIIDAGIQGKLTEQLPEDGDAETLYAQIQDQKSQLTKEGKIKKEKPLPDITADEIPFEIPKNWKWVRLGAVLREVIVPQRDKPKQFDGDIPWCRIEDADGDYMSKSHSNQNVSRKTVEEMNLRVFPTGTILSACSGASIGRILITTAELCTNQTFNGLVCSSGLYNRYLFHYLKKSIGKLKKMGSGAAMEYVSQKKTNEMLLPLPPYAEQKRIVATVEKVLQIVGY